MATSSRAAIKVPDHDAALKALKDKTALAYAADRTVLITTALVRGQGAAFELADLVTYEPYGSTMRRDAVFSLSGRRVFGTRSRWSGVRGR